MGIYLLIFMGGTPFGSLLIGYLTELLGVRETITICGLVSLTASLTIWVVFKDKFERPEDIRVSSVKHLLHLNLD